MEELLPDWQEIKERRFEEEETVRWQEGRPPYAGGDPILQERGVRDDRYFVLDKEEFLENILLKSGVSEDRVSQLLTRNAILSVLREKVCA